VVYGTTVLSSSRWLLDRTGLEIRTEERSPLGKQRVALQRRPVFIS
jgi:hypothetical protein